METIDSEFATKHAK